MKIEYGVLAAIVVVAATAMFFAGCTEHAPAKTEGQRYTMGGDLKLVAEYKPLHLYIYVETASTNKHPDFVILQGNEPLIFTESKSNTVEVTLCETDFRGQLVSTYNSNGQILKRSFADMAQTNYLYFDTNADGLWDGFVMDEAKAGVIKSYVRSNLCWVPRVSNQQK